MINKEIKIRVAETISIPNDWNVLVKQNPVKAIAEQSRVKEEFRRAFAENLICKKFERDEKSPRYLFYKV